MPIIRRTTNEIVSRMKTQMANAGIDTTNSRIANALITVLSSELDKLNQDAYNADIEAHADTATQYDSLVRIATQYGIPILSTDNSSTLRYKIKNYRRELSFGSVQSIRRAAMSVSGVSNVNVISQFYGPATIGVFVEAQNQTIPSTELLTSVRNALLPITGAVHLEIRAPEYLELFVEATVGANTGSSTMVNQFNDIITRSNMGITIDILETLRTLVKNTTIDSLYINGTKYFSNIISLEPNQKIIIDRSRNTALSIKTRVG